MLTFAHKAKVFLHCLNLFSELKKLGMQLSLRNWAKLLVIWVFVFLLFVFFSKRKCNKDLEVLVLVFWKGLNCP